MEIEEYRKQLDELLAKGLTIDEADAVINGSTTVEEALKNHKEKPLTEAAENTEVNMETYDDAEKIMRVVREITARETK